MFSSRGTVRYEERGQGYRDVEKVGKHWSRDSNNSISTQIIPSIEWSLKIHFMCFKKPVNFFYPPDQINPFYLPLNVFFLKFHINIIFLSTPQVFQAAHVKSH